MTMRRHILGLIAILVGIATLVLSARLPHRSAPSPLEDPSEDRVNAIEDALEPLRVGLMNLSIEQACSVFSEGFRGDSPFDTWAPERIREPFELGQRVLDARPLHERAKAFFQPLSLITDVSIKIPEVNDSSVTLKFGIDARDARGLPIEWVDSFEAEFDGALLKCLRRTSSRVSRAIRPVFTEWTAGLEGLEVRNAVLGDGDGVALGDFDGDGFIDIFVPRKGGSTLLWNKGGERFVQENWDEELWATGALAWDANNDGHLDLLLIRRDDGNPQTQKLILMINDGRGHFTRAKAPGLEGAIDPTSACAADIDHDGYLDLFVTQHGRGGTAEPEPYLDARNGLPGLLFHNNGDGTFTEMAAAAGVATRGWGFACAFFDANGDLFPDLYVVNDYGRNHLYLNRGGRTFEDVRACPKISSSIFARANSVVPAGEHASAA